MKIRSLAKDELARDSRSNSRRIETGSESGAGAVEMAVILPLLVLFVAGIMDFGMVFSNLMSLRQGLGAGVRQGIVAQPGTSTTCPMPGAGAASTQTKQLICLIKDRIDLDANDTRTRIVFPGVKTRGGSMIICAQYPLESTTTILGPMLSGQLKSKVEMRIEQDLTAYSAASETALTGGNWSWCA